MNDVIQVTLKENEDMTANPKQYNYVVDVSREAIMDDLKSDQSLVRSLFHDTPDLERFVDEKLEEVQQMIGQKVASTHARRSKPARSGLFSADVEYHVTQRPTREYDDAVGGFGLWEVP